MAVLLDAAYLFALFLASPWLLYKTLTTGKYRRGFLPKFLGTAIVRQSTVPCAWFHGVSVGEIHLLRQVVAAFRQRHPHWDCVLSTTTDTGYDEACKHFPDLPVCFWPFDFSWAVKRALRRVNPSLVVLAEGELWPNFLRAAQAGGVPTAVINGRLSPRSRRRAQRWPGLLRGMIARVHLFAAQTEDYAACYRALGAPADKVHVTGNVKFDGVEANRQNARTQALGRLLGIAADDLVWIAGSTQRPEEAIMLDIYQRLKNDYPQLRLVLVPRQKERFDEVAALPERRGLRCVRRSALAAPLQDRAAVVVLDTFGELGALWGLADVAFVGGSLDGQRGGQNMMEPAAYGAAVVFGPHVWNFQETVDRLLAKDAARQVPDAAHLETTVRRLLSDREERRQLGTAAQQFVQSQQGATARTLDLLEPLVCAESRRQVA